MKAQPEQNRDPKEDDERSMQMAGTTTWGNYGFNTTKPHYGMMTLGLTAGRGAKACQGPAACPAPSTLGDAGAKKIWERKTATSPSQVGRACSWKLPPDLAQELLVFLLWQDRKTKSFGTVKMFCL